jgi:hypothetical protein
MVDAVGAIGLCLCGCCAAPFILVFIVFILICGAMAEVMEINARTGGSPITPVQPSIKQDRDEPTSKVNVRAHHVKYRYNKRTNQLKFEHDESKKYNDKGVR